MSSQRKKKTSTSAVVFDLRERIGLECDLANISRAELARRIGKSAQSFNAILAKNDMKASLLLEISKELDVSMERLMSPVSDGEYVEMRKLKRERTTPATD